MLNISNEIICTPALNIFSVYYYLRTVSWTKFPSLGTFHPIDLLHSGLYLIVFDWLKLAQVVNAVLIP